MDENVDAVIAKYGQKVPKKPSKGRAFIISFVILLLSAAIAVSALLLFKTNSTVDTAPLTNGPTSKEIVDKLVANTTISGSKNMISVRTSNGNYDGTSAMSTIVYQEPGYTFLTNVPAEEGIRFTVADTALPSNKSAITDAMKTVLASNGFLEVSQPTSALSPYGTVTYINKGTVCQVLNLGEGPQSILQQAIICADHAALETSYNSVKTQLTQADASAVSSAKAVRQNITTDLFTTKKLLTLEVLPSKTSYYFAALDTTYSYIGNHATGTAVSGELLKNISDAKWGTFLTDNIK